MKMVPVHAIKVCGGMELQLQSLLTIALDVGEWSASFPRSFTSGETVQVPSEPKVCVDTLEKEKSPASAGNQSTIP
jgi:hypothetical protein